MLYRAHKFPAVKSALNLFLWIALVALSQLSEVRGQNASLTWSPTSDPNVAGYVIYYGGSRENYTNTMVLGLVTNVVVSGLTPGATYYFAATTYDATGDESPFSNEAVYTVPQVGVLQPPTLNTIANVSLNENSVAHVNLSGITPGATSQNSTLTVTATSSNPAIVPSPTVNYTSPNSAGNLLLAPAANASGSATITVTVNNGAASNNVVSQTFTVTVIPTAVANTPPTLNAISNITLNENTTAHVNLAGITTGSTNQTLALTVTATSSNPAVVPAPTVNYSSPNSAGSLLLVLAANASGSATITVTVNNGAASNNTTSQSFTVTVNPISTLNAIPALSLNENAAAQTVNLSGITSGSTNQSLALTVTATSSNPALIPSPTVKYSSPSSTGSLIFAPATNAVGSATITVTASSSGTGNNQVSQSFVVTVNPVPTLNVISNLSVAENAKTQTVNLSGISSGATNQSLALTVAASSSNMSLIGTPTITYTSPNSTGSLTFVPVANATGTSTITVTVINGGTGSNQVSQSFTVTVVNTNAPQITKPLTNTVALVGQTVNMSVTATGLGTLKYYWLHNGAKVTGTTSSLTLTNISSTSAGTYSVTASNSVGTATSTASLTVVPTAAGNLTQAVQPAAGQFKFTVIGVTGYKYAVQATTDMISWTSLETNTAPYVFTDTNSGQFGKRYYRTVYVP
jgi:hypothetical protein